MKSEGRSSVSRTMRRRASVRRSRRGRWIGKAITLECSVLPRQHSRGIRQVLHALRLLLDRDRRRPGPGPRRPGRAPAVAGRVRPLLVHGEPARAAQPRAAGGHRAGEQAPPPGRLLPRAPSGLPACVRPAARLRAAGTGGAGDGDALPGSPLLARATPERPGARPPAGRAGKAGGGGGVRLASRLRHPRAPARRGEGAGGAAGRGGRLLRRAHAAHPREAAGRLHAPPEAPEALAGVPREAAAGAGPGTRAARRSGWTRASRRRDTPAGWWERWTASTSTTRCRRWNGARADGPRR